MSDARPRLTLRQASYTVREVAFLLDVQPRTVLQYMKQDSVKHPGRKLLVATKPTTIWRVAKEDLIKFMEEKFNG